NPQLPRLDWHSISNLSLEPPDPDRFPCLQLAIAAGRQGGTYPAVLCAADEVAVELFLSGRIHFSDIAHLIELTLAEHKSIAHPDLETIIDSANWARARILKLSKGES
ncbi:MAG: 1-deoxy-D-xylulose-5-phosphate reductoisomerase, partial [Dehalococcoidales bacterium]|nr:1-deoxy-D-xylulose-5-phosphate reductoisomerase [Dehalococcoidales bacterium]